MAYASAAFLESPPELDPPSDEDDEDSDDEDEDSDDPPPSFDGGFDLRP